MIAGIRDHELAAADQLLDNYPEEEYTLRSARVRGFLVLTFRLRDHAARELEQVPRDIVYHVDASGTAKLGGVVA